MSFGDVACSHAAMLLRDDCLPITAENIATVLKGAGVSVESYWPALFAKLFQKRSIDDLIMTVGGGGTAAAVTIAVPTGGAPAGGAGAASPEENKRDEPEEGSDDDFMLDLFGEQEMLLSLYDFVVLRLIRMKPRLEFFFGLTNNY